MGRKKKNSHRGKLARVDGSIFNKHGIEFTEEEHKHLKNLADSANRKRRRLLKNEHALTEFFGGRSHGATIGELSGKMGKESDFILAKKSKSLQRFESRREFDSYIKHLENVVKVDYIPNQIETYRKNQIKAIQTAFGKKGNKIAADVRSMSSDEFMSLVQQDEASEIWFIYSEEELSKRLRALRGAVKRVIKGRK